MGNEDLLDLFDQLRTAASASAPAPILLPLLDRLQTEVTRLASECASMQSRLERPLTSYSNPPPGHLETWNQKADQSEATQP